MSTGHMPPPQVHHRHGEIGDQPEPSLTMEFDFSANLAKRGGLMSNLPKENVYTLAVILLFVVLAVVSLVLRLFKMANNHLRHVFAAGPGRDRQTYWAANQTMWWPWTKRYVLYAPFWSKRHNREMQISSAISMGTLPSRFHSVLLLAYVSTNLAYCASLDYSGHTAAEVLAQLRARSGILAVLNLIPTILFALRNNPLIYILQVSYDTFNLLHRWTARIVIIESIVHTLAWLIDKAMQTDINVAGQALIHSRFLGFGLIGAVCFVALGIQAWSPIRHAFWETFLNIHRLLVIASFVGVWIHLDTAHLVDGGNLLKVALAFWIFEWICRIFRILYYNVRRRRLTKVTVEALPSEACRVTFDLVRPWRFSPGCHIHVYIPSVGFWSSHPFTVAWSKDSYINDQGEKLLPPGQHELERDHQRTTSLSIVVRARTGMTRKLYEKAWDAPEKICFMHGFVEGPYGGHESLDSYGTVLLFAGGIGITHQVSYLRKLVEGSSDGTVATRKLVLVWSLPDTEALEWVRPWMDEILRLKGRQDVLKILVFLTKPKSQQEVISTSGMVQMFPGRCNPQTVLDKEFIERIGAMCVTVCGPGGLADSVRHAVRKRVELGTLDFIEESFTY